MLSERRWTARTAGTAGVLALGLALGAAGGPSAAVEVDGEAIGEVDFGAACAEPADVDRALGLMHHMMYAQARGVFEEIAAADPDCAMAHWGIATTLFQPLWGTRPSAEELQRGWRAIEQARERARSEREASLIESTAAFFREPETADFPTRIRRWIEAMAATYEAHPDDPDIAALYGLSLVTLAQRVEDRAPLLDEAEEVLRGVHDEIPTHPGAIHYSIHATDVDGRAENALDMVEAYAGIAPEVPHALHMPSHIYVRLGDWPAVIAWNRRSADAALDHPVGGAVSHHFIHALDYLVYAHLQRGEDDLARAALEEALAKDGYQASFIAAFHAASMPARLAVEQQDWERAAALEPRTPDYLPWDASPWAEGLTWHARGLGAVHTGDREAAEEAEQRLAGLRDRAKADGDEAMAAYIEIDRLVLAGRLAQMRGDDEEAVALTRAAAELEGTVEKHPVTPGALQPPYEALGDLLMELGRPAEALEAYRASDETWPGRYHTLLGAARAAEKAGEEKAASGYYERLLAIAGASRRGAVDEARAFTAE
jgi:tetratricopeptide (TPR) repeat protein